VEDRRNEGDDDGPEKDDVDVRLDESADRGDVAEQVTREGESRSPDHRADEVVEGVLAGVHVADAGGDRHEGAEDRDEAGEDHADSAELGEEGIGALDVRTAEHPALLAFEDLRPEPVADQVAHLSSEKGREADREADPDDRDVDRRRSGGGGKREESGDDEEGIAGEQESDEQAGLGEDDEAHSDERVGPEPLDEGLRIQPRDERRGQGSHEVKQRIRSSRRRVAKRRRPLVMLSE